MSFIKKQSAQKSIWVKDEGKWDILGYFIMNFNKRYSCSTFRIIGLGSSVGIVTDYGLDGPGLNPGRDEIFRLSRPALGPTQPPVKWVLSLCREQSAAGACC